MAKITYRNLNRQYLVSDQTNYEKLMLIKTEILADERTIYDNMTEQTRAKDKKTIYNLEEILMEVDSLILKYLHNMLGLTKLNLSICSIGLDADQKHIDKFVTSLNENINLKAEGMTSAKGVLNDLRELLLNNIKNLDKSAFKNKPIVTYSKLPIEVLKNKNLRDAFFKIVPPDEESLLFLCLNPNVVEWSSLDATISTSKFFNSLIKDYGFTKEMLIQFIPKKSQCFIGLEESHINQEI